jgi:hypothetical protein
MQTAAPRRTPINLPTAQFIFSNLLVDRNSAVGTVTSYKLNDRGILVRLLVRAKNFYLLPNVQTGYGAYPASYSIGTGRYFPGNKAAVMWCWPFNWRLVLSLAMTGVIPPILHKPSRRVQVQIYLSFYCHFILLLWQTCCWSSYAIQCVLILSDTA